jgi:signal transduction histidine kinase
MKLNKLLSSFTFRYSLVYITVLSVSVTVVLAIVYAFTSYKFTNEILGAIEREFVELRSSYDSGGETGVREFLEERTGQGKLSVYFFMLADNEGNKLVGNLRDWPPLKEYPRGWRSFDIDLLQEDYTVTDSRHNYVGKSVVLADGNRLLVARNYHDIRTYYRLIAGGLIRGMLVIIALGTVGGALVSLSFLKRVESINRSIATIMTGNLSERIEPMRRGGDFDRLVHNLNNMLDRIEFLMVGMKQVSDNIAHDLRTPLTRIRNNLSELQVDLGEQGADRVQALIDEADGLLSTFNALLRIARIESEGDRAAFGEVDLNVLLQDVVELYEPLCSEKGQRLELTILGGLQLWADRDLLFQMVSNLVDNASKYAPEGGVIRVVASRDGGDVRLLVTDNGPGIPELARKKVFQRFYRLEASRSLLPGNGLGLSLVAAVVKLHQGEVRLHDNHPGLRVIIRVPTQTS